jgi:hypothetical protein
VNKITDFNVHTVTGSMAIRIKCSDVQSLALWQKIE